jgi:rod shape-determining protein MreC
VGDSGTAAMVVGDFALMREGMTRLSYLAGGVQIFEGDIILSSGRGGAFPKNLVLGSVVSVHTEAGGQVEFATV